ncbi:MAG: AraC family transcriptional regulator [Prevotella sp.]|nr:AraC family transcriptional regulator [Prevotella sp.]
MELTPTLITLIVTTIELMVCLYCAVVLWRQRKGMPDHSRLVLALGAAHCVLTSLLKYRSLITSPTQTIYHEVLQPAHLSLGMLSVLLILAYAVAVVRPEWFRSWRSTLVFFSPGVLFMGVYWITPSWTHLYSFSDIQANIGEVNVLIRAVQFFVIVGYCIFLLFRMVNIRETGVGSLWVRNYILGTLGLLTLVTLFSYFHFYILHYTHQICVAVFYAYWTYYELTERVYTTPSNLSSSVVERTDEMQQNTDYRRFINFDERVSSLKLFTQQGISRDDLCRIMGTDRTTFSRIISEQSGCKNMSDYLNRKRLDYAAQLMREHPDYSISAILSDSGFSSRSNFYRLFSERFGMSPTDYQQLQ